MAFAVCVLIDKTLQSFTLMNLCVCVCLSLHRPACSLLGRQGHTDSSPNLSCSPSCHSRRTRRLAGSSTRRVLGFVMHLIVLQKIHHFMTAFSTASQWDVRVIVSGHHQRTVCLFLKGELVWVYCSTFDCLVLI